MSDFVQQLPKGKRASLPRCDLSNANLGDRNLAEADMTGATLYGANLKFTNLERANLYCADLSNVDGRHANFTRADMRGAQSQEQQFFLCQARSRRFPRCTPGGNEPGSGNSKLSTAVHRRIASTSAIVRCGTHRSTMQI